VGRNERCKMTPLFIMSNDVFVVLLLGIAALGVVAKVLGLLE
jgi:hypothetical protein